MRYFLFLFFTLTLIQCVSDQGPKQVERERPIEPWVFRSVMDNEPRMITLALNRDLYATYQATTGTLRKAWKGIVNFEGAVYNTAHGPQPGTVGDAYIIDTSHHSWSLLKGGKEVPSIFNFEGHRFKNGQVSLLYSLTDDKGTKTNISEQVEAYRDVNAGMLLERRFQVENLPRDYSIRWTGIISSVVDRSNISCDNELTFISEEPVDFNGREYYNYLASLDLNNEKPVSLDIKLGIPIHLDPNLDDGFGKDQSLLPLGARLIGQNDCKTCHNLNKQTVGPSYLAIAKKYPHSDENTILLSNKIKNGGTGIWGNQVMTPHPEIPDADLKEMVNYIFSLAAFEGVDEQKEIATEFIDNVEVDEGSLIPGSVVRVYNIPNNVKAIPADLDKRKAFMAGVLPNFDNISAGDFKGLEENFGMLATGFIEIEEDGEYAFRLWSDDGSKLYLHDELIIDHDGLHGTSMKQVSLRLKKGFHPFKLEYFQGVGGKFLSFNYKDKEGKWQVIPQTMITHQASDHQFIGDLNLPMSIVTKIPGDGQALQAVHPGFDLFQARPDEFNPKVGGMDFTRDGKLLVSTWDKNGSVFILENVNATNPDSIKFRQIASGLAEPLGLTVVDERIFVLQKQELTELIDEDGDGIIDVYKSHCDDWGVTSNFHEFSFGMTHKDDFLFLNLATGIQPGGAGMENQHPDRGSTLAISIEDGSVQKIASGLRTPNGIGLGYDRELFVSDNQGDWLPSSKILHVTEGDWFGSRAVDFEGTAHLEEKPPLVWLPQDEIGNSPSTPLYLDIGPYTNQMIHGEVTHGGIKRVFVEEIDGQLQGCVFRFIQGLEAGINRLTWSPEGDLYVGGIGNPGNWQQSGKQWYGLQRLRYNGNSAFEMLTVKARSDGIEIEFTQPLKEGDGWNPEDYELKQWYYLPTAEYGGPKLDETILDIKSVSISEDRHRVFIETEGLKEDHVVYLRLKNHFVSENEQSLWSTEAWYTLNKIPADKEGFKTEAPESLPNNTLSQTELSQGWELLFDGKTINMFHTFNQEGVGNKWTVADEAIVFDPERTGQGGDIITNREFENFELQLEWKISNCGNSGIFFNAVEGEEYCCPFLTGPEMQILDNTCHPDSRYRTHRAGDLYDMIECRFVTVNPAGQWNKVRIMVDEGETEFWLNGYRVVNFTMFDESWAKMISKSKFKEMLDFGKFKSGHIGLQDHGDKVWFRNIKIREL